MKKKLKLENIKIQSFVTTLGRDELKRPKAGVQTEIDCTMSPCTEDPNCVTASCPPTQPRFICTNYQC